MKRFFIRVLLLLINGMIITLHGSDAITMRCQYFEDIYNFSEWSGKTRVFYDRAISNLVVDMGEKYEKKLIIEKLFLPISYFKMLEVNNYFFIEKMSPSNIINVIMNKCETILDAHRCMIYNFSNCSALQPFPIDATRNVSIGDRCYFGYSDRSIAFVRNNLFVEIDSYDSVIELAKKIDQQILMASLVETNHMVY